MKNREVYLKDPAENRLLNDGVAEVTDGRSDAEMRTLRYELEIFVCDGEYAKGMRRILDTYLRNLDQPMQPGVWVSGFFGSGKSHLVKMLRALWVDVECADGATLCAGCRPNGAVRHAGGPRSTRRSHRGAAGDDALPQPVHDR